MLTPAFTDTPISANVRYKLQFWKLFDIHLY